MNTKLCLWFYLALTWSFSGWAKTFDEHLAAMARERAMEVATAFSDEAFTMRDSYWSGQLVEGEQRIFGVSLFAGNEYWFCLGAAPEDARWVIDVFDERGQPLAAQERAEGSSKAAVRVVPESGGTHFVRIFLWKGEPSHFCVLYSYK